MSNHDHYFFDIPPGVTRVDIYRLIEIIGITCPVAQHVFKKAAAAGRRGHKDLRLDWENILDSAMRKLVMLDEDDHTSDLVAQAVSKLFGAPEPPAEPEPKQQMRTAITDVGKAFIARKSLLDIKTEPPAEHKQAILDGHEVDTDFDSEKERMPAIGTNGNDGGHYAPTLPAGCSWADAPPDATVLVTAAIPGRYYWADAFCDGARIYGAQFERMGLTSSSGWKLVARRPGSDPGWVVGTGIKPDLPDTMYVEVKFHDGECCIDPVGSWIWEHHGSGEDIMQYRVVEALEQ